MTPKILAEPNNLWCLLPAAAVIVPLYFLSPILAPFLFAAILTYISNSLGIGGLAVLGFVVKLLLVPVVLFYLLRDWNALLAFGQIFGFFGVFASSALLMALRHPDAEYRGPYKQ